MEKKERKCSVEGCGAEAVHELSYVDAKALETKAGLKLVVYRARPPRRPGIVYLCSTHYKLWKKVTKSERRARDLARRSG
ncbi:MAG: hypothetical protein DRO13_03285 [Thermoprotei archaeon]|nr:MAG: hypothetical protein DRO13_03285 [Thermoprotei archaeon]